MNNGQTELTSLLEEEMVLVGKVSKVERFLTGMERLGMCSLHKGKAES